ncbi:MAG: PDZ domain-containing protein [Acidobacteriota bacterium]
MGVWKIIGVAALGLAVAAGAAVWAPGVAGQAAKNRESGIGNRDSGEGRSFVEADGIWGPGGTSQAETKAKQTVVARKRAGGTAVFVGEGDGPQVVAFGEAFGQMGGSRLGVRIRDVEKDDVEKMKLPSPSGVVIDEVTDDSPAAKAGLKAGDVVVQFDGEQVRSASQFVRLVRETPAGRAVKMSVMRGGSRVDVTATTEGQAAAFSWVDEGPRANAERLRAQAERLRAQSDRLRQELERSTRERQRELAERDVLSRVAPDVLRDRLMWFGEGPMAMVLRRGRLGVSIQDLTPELAEYFGVKDGVLVSSVDKDSPAAKAGIKAGDVITSVDGKSVEDTGDLLEAIRGKAGEVSIGLSRDRKALTVKATIEKAEAPRGRIITRGRII